MRRSVPVGAKFFRYAICLVGALSYVVSGFAAPAGASPQAAGGSISGTVTVTTAEGVAQSLADVPVTLTGPSPAPATQSTVTDSEGRYKFAALAPGSYTMGAALEGFKPWTATLTLTPGQAALQDAALELNSLAEKVEVRGEATEIATQSATATATVSDRQLEDLPLRTRKFAEALYIVPSVIKTAEGRLNFNGQAENQGMLLVDMTENVDPVSGSFSIPVPLEAIQSIKVINTPDSAAYGGFSAALTQIETRPPAPDWNYKLLDFVPSFRAKSGHVVGLANMTPRVYFGGPVVKGKLNFSEDLSYEFRRDPVRGLSWPYNETYTYSFGSFTDLQWTPSQKQIININLNIFPSTNLYSNINTLIPQVASVNFQRRGESLGVSDAYQFDSGVVVSAVVRYTNFYSDAHGQSTQAMTIGPEGWGGNYFNAWERNANQVEALPAVQLPARDWLGRHETKFGVDLLYRTFTGSTASQPVNLFEESGTAIDEQIKFQGAGALRGSDTEVSEYAEDNWTLSKSLAVTLGGRLTTQSKGRGAAFAPRAGLAYSVAGGKMVVRAGTGLMYSHVPMLAEDFAGNQTRVVSCFAGSCAGQTVTLRNAYLPFGPPANSASPGNPADSPRTFTWNVEAEAPLRHHVTVRLGYYETSTTELFLVNPVLPATGTIGMLALENTGSARYRQAQIAARYQPSERAEVNVVYSWSRARGDLNTLSDTFIPFPAPVIRPNQYGVQPSDVPNRFLAWGSWHAPIWGLIIAPVMDLRTGLPYSNVNVLQDYVGAPNSSRFPTYFSLDGKIYRDFTFHLPFRESKGKGRKFRFGVYSLDLTNRHNPHDVYNNVASPLFRQFAGFQRRFSGLVIGFGE
jgi:Carboxypeptidase regulatory-like domain